MSKINFKELIDTKAKAKVNPDYIWRKEVDKRELQAIAKQAVIDYKEKNGKDSFIPDTDCPEKELSKVVEIYNTTYEEAEKEAIKELINSKKEYKEFINSSIKLTSGSYNNYPYTFILKSNTFYKVVEGKYEYKVYKQNKKQLYYLWRELSSSVDISINIIHTYNNALMKLYGIENFNSEEDIELLKAEAELNIETNIYTLQKEQFIFSIKNDAISIYDNSEEQEEQTVKIKGGLSEEDLLKLISIQ